MSYVLLLVESEEEREVRKRSEEEKNEIPTSIITPIFIHFKKAKN